MTPTQLPSLFLVTSLLAVASPASAARNSETARNPETQKAEQKAKEIYPEPKQESEKSLKAAVQITEVGLMRTLVVLSEEAKDLEKLVHQRLSDVDFRVFPSAKVVKEPLSAAAMRHFRDEVTADMILIADVKTREKSALGEFKIFEGEATVRISSPVSGELLISQTNRVSGVRHVDEQEAIRSARERALDMATREAIPKALEKAHKMVVHTARVTAVTDEKHLLAIKEHIARMEGVYHVRQIHFDPVKRVAELEIIASPKAEEFWRAWLTKIPRTEIVVTLAPKPSASQGNGIPAWFPTKK
ncbi:MAG: hypothetical protein RLZZ244_3178 [Verrucomicrobiota bacterium]|jgi:hypothetical protein